MRRGMTAGAEKLSDGSQVIRGDRRAVHSQKAEKSQPLLCQREKGAYSGGKRGQIRSSSMK